MLGLLVASAFAVRLGYLDYARGTPGYDWDDPDSFAHGAHEIAGRGAGWSWTFDAVRFGRDGVEFALPPLYPLFLSVFWLLPHFPVNAQVAQILLGCLAILVVFQLGRLLHSPRAGLLAAGVYALWLPNIIAVWSTGQEALYVPLVVVAFFLLMRAVLGARRWPVFLAAGAVWGLAALTRSFAVYYVPPAAALVVLLSRGRKTGLRNAAALLLGVVAATFPYSVLLSRHLGRWTYIENHGGLYVLARYGPGAPSRPPGFIETVRMTTEVFLRSPKAFLREGVSTAQGLFQVHGGRLLERYLAADTKSGSFAWKGVAHLFADLPFLMSVLLAPFGLVFLREQRAGPFIALWIALHLAVAGAIARGGPRMRSPFEPHLLILGAVAVAPRFRRPHPFALAAAAAVSLLGAAATVPFVERSLAARGDYGIYWKRVAEGRVGKVAGAAGFNVEAFGEGVAFRLLRSGEGPLLVEVRLDGEPASQPVALTGPDQRALQYHRPPGTLTFVELVAVDARRQPGEVTVFLP